MYNNQYTLAYNPFDKQQIPEKDCFRSKDFQEMTARLDYPMSLACLSLSIAL